MTNQVSMDVKRPLSQLAPMPVPRAKESDSWTVRNSKRAMRNVVIPFTDWTLKVLATLFIVVTSLHDVALWLHQNRVNHDFSLAGAILIISVALYLIARKR